MALLDAAVTERHKNCFEVTRGVIQDLEKQQQSLSGGQTDPVKAVSENATSSSSRLEDFVRQLDEH